DAGQRVLQLVGDAGGHLAERGQPVAEPLLFLDLLDPGQVLEEEDGADRRVAAFVPDMRNRVADYAIEILQPELGAVRQVAELERAEHQSDDFGPLAQHVGEGATDVARRRGQAENPVRLVVHQRQGAVAPERDDSIAHTGHQVPEEPVVGVLRRSYTRTPFRHGRRNGRGGRTAPRAGAGTRIGVGHRGEHLSSWLYWANRMPGAMSQRPQERRTISVG